MLPEPGFPSGKPPLLTSFSIALETRLLASSVSVLLLVGSISNFRSLQESKMAMTDCHTFEKTLHLVDKLTYSLEIILALLEHVIW